MNRRNFLRLVAGTSTACALPATAFAGNNLSTADEAFLDDMERSGCRYFQEQASPVNGQVLDRAVAVSDGKLDPRRMASIAATGFGLTSLCIADKRSYMPRKVIVE